MRVCAPKDEPDKPNVSLKHDAVLVLAPRGEDTTRNWQAMTEIRRDDSSHFCEDCSKVLGWLLDGDMDKEAVSREWERLLPGTRG
jgi:hypothetical protein